MFNYQDKVLMNILEGYFSSPSGNYFWHRKRKEVLKILDNNQQLISNYQNTKEITFLELGCGQAIDLFLIRNWCQKNSLIWNFIGVEAQPTLLEICNFKKQNLQANNVEFISSDITQKLPFDDGSINLIYCSEVIEHLADPQSFLEEIKRILQSEGYLLLTTPNEPNIFQRSYWSKKRYGQMIENMKSIKIECEKASLNPEEVCLYGHISVKKISEWDKILNDIGFTIVDYGRGATVYGASFWWDQEWVLGFRFLLEAIVDILPKQFNRYLSDQLIALYKINK